MRVPHKDKVIHQTFNANKVEFVWRFETDKQLILSIQKDGWVEGEAGRVNEAGNYINDVFDLRFCCQKSKNEKYSTWPAPLFDQLPEYNFFNYGRDLIPLVEDVVEFLK